MESLYAYVCLTLNDLQKQTELHTPELSIFSSISLESMNELALMKRTDTKFILHKKQLSNILTELSSTYHILEIDGQRFMSYQSEYYDTPALQFYHMHHTGIAKRIKVRTRKYVNSDLSFLEVKQKNHFGDTIKQRLKIVDFKNPEQATFNQFIKKVTGRDFTLKKSLENNFNRFTLANTQWNERVTVDTNIGFNGRDLNTNLVVIELKQANLNRHSPVFAALKQMGIHPYGFSKYCIGMAAENQELKQNIFKPKFLKIDKITRE